MGRVYLLAKASSNAVVPSPGLWPRQSCISSPGTDMTYRDDFGLTCLTYSPREGSPVALRTCLKRAPGSWQGPKFAMSERIA